MEKKRSYMLNYLFSFFRREPENILYERIMARVENGEAQTDYLLWDETEKFLKESIAHSKEDK